MVSPPLLCGVILSVCKNNQISIKLPLRFFIEHHTYFIVLPEDRKTWDQSRKTFERKSNQLETTIAATAERSDIFLFFFVLRKIRYKGTENYSMFMADEESGDLSRSLMRFPDGNKVKAYYSQQLTDFLLAE